MDVALQLLGAVDGQVRGQALDLGHARQRSVLAALLVDVGRPVSTDALVDRVWGDRAPASAVATLHSYLSRLRRGLAHTGEVALLRRPGGYVVDVEPRAVDLHRFRALVRGAGECADPGQALRMLREGLGLWQGEPLAGLDTVWADGLRAALTRERHAAELDCADLALRRGEHAQVLAALVERAADHPLDERIAGQLVLALYRCGRQADALAQYERTRSRLAEELGADPGPELRRLHQQILRGDTAVAVPGVAGAGDVRGSGPGRAPVPHASPVVLAVPTPRQLPAPLTSFTGRDADLAVLDGIVGTDDASEGVAIAAVTGAPGMGKTCLALHWAHAHVDDFPDGQLHAHLRGFDPTGDPVEPATVLRDFLEALGVAPAAVPAQTSARAAMFRTLVAGRRMLVVLDDARDSEHVRDLLPGRGHSSTIVTSRHQLHGLVAARGARAVILGPLAERDASGLLARRLGGRRLAAEPDATRALLRHCAGLPLALGIIAARAASRPDFPLAALADELEVAATRLDVLGSPEEAIDVRGVIRCSYDAVTPPAADLFRLLALVPGPDVGLAAVASMTGWSPERARRVARELVAVSLVDERVPGRYRMHDLVRLVARDLAIERDDAPRRRAAIRRLLDHHLHTAYAADRLLQPQRDPIVLDAPLVGVQPDPPADHAQAVAWFVAEREGLLAAISLALEEGLDVHAWSLAWSVATFLDRHSHWPDLVATQRVAVQAARRLDDMRALACCLLGLGFACIRIGRHREARADLQHAHDLFTTLEDRTGHAHAHRGLARAAATQGRPGDALPHDERALALYEESGHLAGQAVALNAIGWHLAHLGRPAEARRRCSEALQRHRDLGDAWGMALTLDSLGLANDLLAEPGEAVRCYEESLVLLRSIGHRFEEAQTLVRLGDVQRGAGDVTAARTSWRAAHRILAELRHARAGAVRGRLLLDATPRPPLGGGTTAALAAA